MHRRNKQKSQQSANFSPSSGLLPSNNYDAIVNNNIKRFSSASSGGSNLGVKLLLGSILSLSMFVTYQHMISSSVDDALKNHSMNPTKRKVNGHWKQWLVDDGNVGPKDHRIVDNDIGDDDDDENLKRNKNERKEAEMVQGKYFKMYRQTRTKEQANKDMLEVRSSNVEGEKKLKQALQRVVDEQKKGNDLNVDVISRWMGDDVSVIKRKQDVPFVDTETEILNKSEDEQKERKLEPSFPSPADLIGDSNVQVVLSPAFGEHRPDKNAVFAFAEGYTLDIYAGFIDSLLDTGFDGDIVLSVSALDKLAPDVEAYLKSKPNLVVYTVQWDCFKKSGQAIDNANGGMSDCSMHGMFARKDGTLIDDPREPRPVATARYELYWAWCLHYNAHSQILLIDSRDTLFQRDPFIDMKPSTSAGGVLRLYGENADATSLSISSFNRNWLIAAYGKEAHEKIKDRPVICSGSTAGEQVAIESYLRAMVLQFDETKCKKKGCDQGFHNYLHYYYKLLGKSGISQVIVYDQGKGAVNNLGAMKEKPLTEWGILDTTTNLVSNWDKSISPVIHQVDRDTELRMISNAKRREYVKKWKDERELS